MMQLAVRSELESVSLSDFSLSLILAIIEDIGSDLDILIYLNMYSKVGR